MSEPAYAAMRAVFVRESARANAELQAYQLTLARGYDPNEPRHPKGHKGVGGRWTKDGESDAMPEGLDKFGADGNKVWESLPPEARQMLADGGVAYETTPGAAGVTGAKGVYDYLGHSVQVTEGASAGIVAHETGHAVDNMLVGGGKPGKWFWSSNKEYTAAVKEDLRAASGARGTEYKKMLNGAYDKSQHATETFADVFVTQRAGLSTRGGNYTPSDIAEILPRSSALVRKLKLKATP